MSSSFDLHTGLVRDGASCVLFADDDAEATNALIQSLKRNGADFRMELRTTADDAVRFVRTSHPDVAVVDLTIDPQQGPESGLKLIRELLSAEPNLRVLVLTGQGADEFGIQSLQSGAASFLQKPVDSAHLLALVKDALACSQLKKKLAALSADEDRLASRTGLFSSAPRMQKAIEAAAFAGSNRQPVLLVGETGSGKGVFARAIHQLSATASGPFIRFQPSFGTTDLISSELFGHQKGAFTGAIENRKGLVEEADGGTLFIDEVDELPGETQVLLLNVLQEKTFRRLGSSKEQRSDFRLIAATNRPIRETLQQKRLREDFYHRIAHCTIELPPLRDRIEDIPTLAHRFAAELINKEDLEVQGLSFDAVQRLLGHRWPGNVRELQAAVEGGVYRANYRGKRFVEHSDLSLQTGEDSEAATGESFRSQVEAFERNLIEEALKKCDGNQSKAAALLQLDRSTLRRILARE